eukprot:gene8619-6051_t
MEKSRDKFHIVNWNTVHLLHIFQIYLLYFIALFAFERYSIYLL